MRKVQKKRFLLSRLVGQPLEPSATLNTFARMQLHERKHQHLYPASVVETTLSRVWMGVQQGVNLWPCHKLDGLMTLRR